MSVSVAQCLKCCPRLSMVPVRFQVDLIYSVLHPKLKITIQYSHFHKRKYFPVKAFAKPLMGVFFLQRLRVLCAYILKIKVSMWVIFACKFLSKASLSRLMRLIFSSKAVCPMSGPTTRGI